MKVGYHCFAAAGSFFVYDTVTNALVETPASVHHALEACRRKGWPPLEARSRLRSELTDRAYLEATAWLRDAGRRGMFRPYATRDYTRVLAKDPRKELACLHGLVLGITERCNFRCRYCTYSGHYRGRRTHSEKSMTWPALRRSLDFFLPRATPDSWVSFYGGEPMLEWRLLTRAVRYLRDTGEPGSSMKFHLTTNGSLIDDRMLDFLIEQDGAVNISLDGPAGVHDRVRQFRGGGESFERVMRSVERIRSRSETWYRSHVSFTCVIGRRQDLPRVLKFFGSDDLVRDMPVRAVGLHPAIDPRQAHALGLGSTALDRSLELPEAFLESLAGRNDGFGQRLFISLFAAVFVILAGRRVGALPPEAGLHAMCYPGAERVYVEAEGRLYVCNRIDVEDGRIGDVDRGFDYDRVHALARFFADYCQSACQDCWAQRLCTFCAAKANQDGRLSVEHLAAACRDARERWKHWLRVFAYIWKREEELGVTEKKYSLHWCVEDARTSELP